MGNLHEDLEEHLEELTEADRQVREGGMAMDFIEMLDSTPGETREEQQKMVASKTSVGDIAEAMSALENYALEADHIMKLKLRMLGAHIRDNCCYLGMFIDTDWFVDPATNTLFVDAGVKVEGETAWFGFGVIDTEAAPGEQVQKLNGGVTLTMLVDNNYFIVSTDSNVPTPAKYKTAETITPWK